MLPWTQYPLNKWAVVGMNHYFVEGRKHLFVAMVKGDRCIKAEGEDEARVFADLKVQAELLETPSVLAAATARES